MTQDDAIQMMMDTEESELNVITIENNYQLSSKDELSYAMYAAKRDDDDFDDDDDFIDDEDDFEEEDKDNPFEREPEEDDLIEDLPLDDDLTDDEDDIPYN